MTLNRNSKLASKELISTLRDLSRADKFYVMQVLLSELAQQETDLIKPDQSYPVWSPHDANEAADMMLKVLHTAQNQDHAEYCVLFSSKAPE